MEAVVVLLVEVLEVVVEVQKEVRRSSSNHTDTTESSSLEERKICWSQKISRLESQFIMKSAYQLRERMQRKQNIRRKIQLE